MSKAATLKRVRTAGGRRSCAKVLTPTIRVVSRGQASILASPSAVSSAGTLALRRIIATYPVRRPIRERPKT